jgi:hypothetical protein
MLGGRAAVSAQTITLILQQRSVNAQRECIFLYQIEFLYCRDFLLVRQHLENGQGNWPG